MGMIGEIFSGESQPGMEKYSGITTGIVKENWDKEHPGMVKVEYVMWENGQNISGWVPVMSPYAGNGYGCYLLPEIGSVVILAFFMGVRDCPVVLGSLWNKKVELPKETADQDNTKKTFQSRGGSLIQITDEDGKEKIEIRTPGGLEFVLEDENQKISLADKDKKNAVELDAKAGAVTISAEKKLVLMAGGAEVFSMDKSQAALTNGTLNLEAKQSLKVKGQSSRLEGGTVEVKANGTLKLESSGIAQVKGSMLKLN